MSCRQYCWSSSPGSSFGRWDLAGKHRSVCAIITDLWQVASECCSSNVMQPFAWSYQGGVNPPSHAMEFAGTSTTALSCCHDSLQASGNCRLRNARRQTLTIAQFAITTTWAHLHLKTYNRHVSELLGKSEYLAMSSSNRLLHNTPIIAHSLQARHETSRHGYFYCVRSSMALVGCTCGDFGRPTNKTHNSSIKQCTRYKSKSPPHNQSQSHQR